MTDYSGSIHGTKARELFMNGYNCAQAVFVAFCDLTGYSVDEAARLSSSFGGGFGRLREVCGAVSGASMALGCLIGYDEPGNDIVKKEHYAHIQDFAARFREKFGMIVCRELLEIKDYIPDPNPTPRDEAFYRKRRCADYVEYAAVIVDEMLAEKAAEEEAKSFPIHGLQKLTLLDFPGKVACTVFTGGCNFRCPFCHNASLVSASIDGEGSISENEFFTFIESRKSRLDGVCISGGEPLLQPGLSGFIAKIKARGFAVKLDTNGFLCDRLERLIKSGNLDFIAMDIKSSEGGYARASGLPDGSDPLPKIRKAISLIKTSGIPHEFRTTIVRGLHTPDDISGAARLVAEGGGEDTENYFLQSFKDSGDIISPGYDAFSEAELREMLSSVCRILPNAELRGV